jgi:CBS domain-containing protein
LERSAEVSQKMGGWWVRRLPVVDQDKHLVGIVSLGDLVVETAESKESTLADFEMTADS